MNIWRFMPEGLISLLQAINCRFCPEINYYKCTSDDGLEISLVEENDECKYLMNSGYLENAWIF